MSPQSSPDPVAGSQPLVLGDDDVAQLADMKQVIPAIERAMRARADGAFVSPPRHHVTFPGHGDLTFTIGGATTEPAYAGFRVYDTFAAGHVSNGQIVALWNLATGRLDAVILGNRLGAIRTGAIGGVAIDTLARSDASSAALIGTGAQAETQIAAMAAVRTLDIVRVFSRSEDSRTAFADRHAERLGLPVVPVASAEEAVTDADIVVLATASTTPVMRASWLKPGAHVTTVGPKSRLGHELGLDAAERAAVIATDSPEQVAAYADPFFLSGTPAMARMIDLSDIVAGRLPGRQNDKAITLFCSVGLAGTEVMAAAAIVAAARGR